MAPSDEIDPRIPNTSTAWQLWYTDMFDRDAPQALQARGKDIVQGLSELWLQTLKEAIQDNGSGSFSRFYLTWGISAAERVDVLVDPFNNVSLLKLRQWAGLMSPHTGSGDTRILMRLAQLHHALLQESSRWQAPAIDWSGESRELLKRVELMSEPEEL